MPQRLQQQSPPPFLDHLRDALVSLRAALLDLLLAVDADPARPQDLARRFGLNKNLTWKVSKIIGASDPFATVQHIPGPSGLEIFLRAMEKADAPRPLLHRARTAASEFDRVVEIHTGDRATLEIMIGGILPRAQQHEQSRKLAYQGNSATWGARARAQLALNILAPSRSNPGTADLVQAGGLVDFRRLRPETRWLLFRRERWSDDDPSPARGQAEAIDPDFPSEGVPLIGQFCSKPIPSIDIIADQGEDQYELPPGPVGNTAAITCIYGEITRSVGDVFADRPGEFSEIGCNLITPAEHLLLDLLVHRDMTWALDPELVVYSRLDGSGMHATTKRRRNVLPISTPITKLGSGTMALTTSVLPEYRTLAEHIFDRLGWSPSDFVTLHVEMAYPPIPTAVLLRSELPCRP